MYNYTYIIVVCFIALLLYCCICFCCHCCFVVYFVCTPTCHIPPPSEIDRGMFLTVFTSPEGTCLFHRIG